MKTELFGYGLKEGPRDTSGARRSLDHPIRGVREQAKVHHRIPITGSYADLVADRGASGTPLFRKSGEMVGIITEVQGQQTAFYIPCSILKEVEPNLTARPESAVFPRRSGLSKHDWFRLCLSERLHGLDRVPQWNAFKSHCPATGAVRPSSFVCLIAGTHADLPEACRTKIEHEFEASRRLAQRASAPLGNDVDADLIQIKLPWPVRRSPRVEESLLSLARSLHDDLSDLRDLSSVEPIRAALAKEIKPLLFYSVVEEAHFSESHLQLLSRWTSLLEKIGQSGLSQPIVHFLVLSFPVAETAAAADEDLEPRVRQLLGDSPRGGWLRRLLGGDRATGEVTMVEDREGFRRLPLLEPVDMSDVESWINAVAAELQFRLDDPVVAMSRQEFRPLFDRRAMVRLKDVELRARVRSAAEGSRGSLDD